MTPQQIEAMKLALEALKWCHGGEPCGTAEAITALEKALAQPEQEPVQVSPLEFVTMTLEKEHLVGKPIIWAEWPCKEKNT